MLFVIVGIFIIIGTIAGIIHRCTFTEMSDFISKMAFLTAGLIGAVIFLITTLGMPRLYTDEEIRAQAEKIEYFENVLEEKTNQLLEQGNITYKDIKNDDDIQKTYILLEEEAMELKDMKERNTKIKQWEYIAWFGGGETANENLSN